LVTRRSSDPPAPQTATLPPLVLGIIASKLSEAPPVEAQRDVVRASLASKEFQAAVAGEKPAMHRLLQAPLVQKARKLAEKLAGSNDPQPSQRDLCVTALELMDRQHQEWVISSVLSGSSQSDDDDRFCEDIKQTEIYQVYDKLAPRLAHLDKTLQTKLVTKAAALPYPADAAMAAGGLGGGLAHLDPPLIDWLVDVATGQPSEIRRAQLYPFAGGNFAFLKNLNEHWRAQAIRALSAGLAHMNPHQRQRMYEAATRIGEPQHQGWVLEGLGGEMKYLPPKQQDELFERASLLSDPAHLAHALAGLARSIDVLSEERTETVLAAALQLPERNDAERKRKRDVVCALATQVEHLTPTQRERLVARILSGRSCNEIEALGPGLGHLPPEQQDQLLETVASLSRYDKAAIVAGHTPTPSSRIGWSALQAKPAMAAALPSLAPARRDKVAAIVLGIYLERDDSATHYTARAIGALGPHLKHLEEGRRNALLEQAMLVLGHPHTESWRPHTIQAMTRGLGTGLGALREDQRQALVTTVVNMDSLLPSSGRDPSFANRLMNYAEAIAGLASGQQHLSTLEFKELIEAADRMQAACGFTDNNFDWMLETLQWVPEDERAVHARSERLRIVEALAVALIGLAAA